MPEIETALAAYRRKSKQTLETLALALDVNKSTVLRWETGEVPIPTTRLADLEKLTGIPRKRLRPDIFQAVS